MLEPENGLLGHAPSSPSSQRSHSLSMERDGLQCIMEDDAGDAQPPNPKGVTTSSSVTASMTAATATQKASNPRRAMLVKKAIRYFDDKSNRSVSEDNLFTRRKNLAVHLGLDEKVSKKEVQKINTYSLPVPSCSFDYPDAAVAAAAIAESSSDDDKVGKNLVDFLGMKDGLTASMASRGSLCYTSATSDTATVATVSTTVSSTASGAATTVMTSSAAAAVANEAPARL